MLNEIRIQNIDKFNDWLYSKYYEDRNGDFLLFNSFKEFNVDSWDGNIVIYYNSDQLGHFKDFVNLFYANIKVKDCCILFRISVKPVFYLFVLLYLIIVLLSFLIFGIQFFAFFILHVFFLILNYFRFKKSKKKFEQEFIIFLNTFV